MLEVLIAEGILIKSGGYFPGVKSNSYSFPEKVLMNGFEAILVKGKKSSFFGKSEDYDVEKLNNHTDIVIKSTASNLLKLDVPSLNEIENSDLSEFQMACRKFCVDNLSAGRIHCTVDRFSRLHSNLSNMPRDIRKLLKVEGENIHCLDVSACFPTLLFTLVKYPAEAEKYADWLKMGFYEQIMIRIGYPEEFRSPFKKNFNSWLNGRHEAEIIDVMKAEFPMLYTDIRAIKFGNYRQVGYDLMRLEAKIMLQTVLREFWNQFPDAFALPLHDAVYTTAEHCGFLGLSMQNAFRKHIGIIPVIKIDPELEYSDKAAA